MTNKPGSSSVVGRRLSAGRAESIRTGSKGFPSQEVFLNKLLKERAYLEALSWDYTGRHAEVISMAKVFRRDSEAFTRLFEQLDDLQRRPSTATMKTMPRTRVEVVDKLFEILRDSYDSMTFQTKGAFDQEGAGLAVGGMMPDLQIAALQLGDKETVVHLRKRCRRALLRFKGRISCLSSPGLTAASFGLFWPGHYTSFRACFADDLQGLAETCLSDIELYADVALPYLESENLNAVEKKRCIRFIASVFVQNAMVARDGDDGELKSPRSDLSEHLEKRIHRPLRRFHDAIKRSGKMMTVIVEDDVV